MRNTTLTRSGIISSCIGCGVEFETQNPWQLRCKPNCSRSNASRNGARKHAQETRVTNFVGVDGEGVTDENGHRYVLLSVGDRSFHRDGKHLDFMEVMEFLYSCYSPDEVYIGYFLGYDFTQWLRTLPEDRARMLLSKEGIALRARRESGSNPTPFPVYYEQWEFDLLAGRRFKLRPQGSKQWMYICDVGGYFQMPFVKASDPSEWKDVNGNPIEIVTPDEKAIIERGKARRADAKLDKEMIAYNQAENRVLARMMRVMSTGLKDIGVELNKSQWIGPGQAVQAWMKDHNTHTRDAVVNAVPANALDMARQSFFGGWFEITHHGHVPGTVYEYDINSAYPSIHSRLPCLLHGVWTSGSGKPPKKLFGKAYKQYTLVRAEVAGNDIHLGAMLHRTPKGRVLRPNETSGVYWLHELEAAIRADCVEPSRIKYKEWKSYAPCKCVPPMAELANLYEKRNAVGKATPQGKSLKLIYNSAYGKTAQSIGAPKFANPIHASLITAGCRTLILDAIATHPERCAAVVMVATDGIYFRSPHPTLDIGKGLGQWEGCERQNMCLVMPGIYWDDEVRSNRARAKIKSRGVNAAALVQMIDVFDEQLATFDLAGNAEWPKVDCTMNFAMVTARQAIQRNDYTQCGLVKQNYVKTLSSDPHKKRVPPLTRAPDGTIVSIPWERALEGLESVPYSGRFGEELELLVDEHISDDGLPIDMSMAKVLYEW